MNDLEDQTEVRKLKGTKQQIGTKGDSERETVIYVEPIVNDVIPSALAFKQLEHNVNNFTVNEEFRNWSETRTLTFNSLISCIYCNNFDSFR